MNDLLSIARELKERLGVNVIFVDRNRTPVGVGMYEDLYEREQLMDEIMGMWERARSKATGVAILGNYICKEDTCYPKYRLFIVDVDDPRVFNTKYAEYLPSTGMVWSTGPRCPEDWDKHDITCTPTPDGRDYECVHRTKDGQTHPFKLRENNDKRGMALLYVISEECLRSIEREVGRLPSLLTLEKGAIEVRFRGYELVPPSLHPSNVPYEWLEKKWFIAEMPCETFRKLISDYINQVVEARKAGRVVKVAEVKILTDEQIERLIKHVLPYYKRGFRDTVHFSMVSFLVTHRVDYESARKFTERLVREANDEEADRRLYNVDWAYKKATEKRPGMLPRVWGRNTIISHMAKVIRAVDKVEEEDNARAMAIEWVAELYRILGIESLVRGFIVVESFHGLKSGKNAVIYLVNDSKWGIVRIVKRCPSKTKVRSYILDQCAKEAGCDVRNKDCKLMVLQCMRGKLRDEEYVRHVKNALTKRKYYVLLPGVYVKKARIVMDEVSGTEYINADIYVREGKRRILLRFRYVTIDEILKNEYIKKRMSTTVSLNTARRALLAVLWNISEENTKQ